MNTSTQEDYVFFPEEKDNTPIVYGSSDGSIYWNTSVGYNTNTSMGYIVGPDIIIPDSSQITPKRVIPDIIDKYINREVSGNLIYVNSMTKLRDFEIISTNMKMMLTTTKTFAEQVTTENMTYVIQHTFDMNQSALSELPVVTVPRGVTLEFTGGGFLKNCILFGNGAIIKASKHIFENVHIEGMWDCPGDVEWFSAGTKLVKNEQYGYIFSSLEDKSTELQLALDSSFRELHFPAKYYYITKPLVLTKEKKIIIHGSAMKLSLGMTNSGRPNNCVIFSDQNITLLKIAASENYQNSISIIGGNFDVSMCNNYTASCIQIVADESGQKMWGVNIETNIKGKYNQQSGIGLDINPTKNTSLTGNVAYITQVRINSNISDFGTGMKAFDYKDKTTNQWYNWCTDIIIDGCITNCKTAIRTNTDIDIRAMIQAGYFFDSLENGGALIVYDGERATISSNIYDTYQGGNGMYTNQYALEVIDDKSNVNISGNFASLWVATKPMKFPFVKVSGKDASEQQSSVNCSYIPFSGVCPNSGNCPLYKSLWNSTPAIFAKRCPFIYTHIN